MSEAECTVHVKLVGCGNLACGDDGAGIVAVRLLREEISKGNHRARWPNLRLDIVEADGSGLTVLDLLQGEEIAFFVDAVVAGAEPGTVYRFDGLQFARDAASAHRPYRYSSFLSSHDVGLAAALSLGQELFPERMPKTVVVWGVEPEDLGFRESLSHRAAMAVPMLVSSLCDELGRVAAHADSTAHHL